MALWRIRATVDDRPGYLSVLTASLALRSVNILAVQVHTTEGGAVDDFLVDAPDTAHALLEARPNPRALIVGSGMSFHNLRAFGSTDPRVLDAAQRVAVSGIGLKSQTDLRIRPRNSAES